MPSVILSTWKFETEETLVAFLVHHVSIYLYTVANNHCAVRRGDNAHVLGLGHNLVQKMNLDTS